MIHHYTCQQAVYSRFIAPSKTEAAFLEVNYVSTHAGIISRSSTRGPSRTQGTIHHNVPMYRTCWRGQQTTVTVISAAVMVQRSCGVPQAGRACSKAPLPHRTSRCHALAEGRMVFSGRQQCRGLRQGQGNAGISENKVDEIRTRRMKVPKKKKKKSVTWHHSFYFISWIVECLETRRGKPPSFLCLHFSYQASTEVFFNHIIHKTCMHAQSETVMWTGDFLHLELLCSTQQFSFIT